MKMEKRKDNAINKDCIESAYCFFHQKWRVYEHSGSLTQKDDIEYAISSYAEEMNPSLYAEISNGRKDFLLDHKLFATDMPIAIERLEAMMQNTDEEKSS